MFGRGNRGTLREQTLFQDRRFFSSWCWKRYVPQKRSYKSLTASHSRRRKSSSLYWCTFGVSVALAAILAYIVIH
jgi:hypothetical protein